MKTVFLNDSYFGDESTFHISGKVIKHNVRIWRTENPKLAVQHDRDSSKLNVFFFCGVSNFRENAVKGVAYLSTLSGRCLNCMKTVSNSFGFKMGRHLVALMTTKPS